MKYAGIDAGSSLIKAFWRVDGSDRYMTVDGTTSELERLSAALRADGVRHMKIVGTGARAFVVPQQCSSEVAAGIDEEIGLQAEGVRWMLAQGGTLPKRMLIASVGTGVSYTLAGRWGVKRSPLGSAHGGGTVMGIAALAGVRDFPTLVALAEAGTPPDLLVKDRLPETAGTPVGELIIAHFARPGADLEDVCAGIFSFSAASVFKDLAILRTLPFSPKDIVVIGKVGCALPFRKQFLRFAAHFKKGTNVHVPPMGEYAAAIGAWRSLSR